MKTSSKNIAILIDSLAGGGAERVMLTLAQTFIRQGHECCILVLDDVREHDLPREIPIYAVPLRTGYEKLFPSKAIASLLATLSQSIGSFDLHISNLEKTNLAVAKLNLPRTLYVIHNSVKHTLKPRWWQPFKWWMTRQSIRSLTGKSVVAVSQGVKDGIVGSALLNPQKLTTIYNPLALSETSTLADALDDEIPQEPYLIHVGRVAKQKRHDVLFEALAKVKKPIKLVCLCRNVNKARKLAEKYGVEDRVILPGFKQNPYPWIKQAKALVLSSDFEGFAMVLVEALSLGVGVISSDCDYGPREILTGPLAKWLVETGDSSALAEKINNYVDEPPEYYHPEILSEVQNDKAASRYLELAERVFAPEGSTVQVADSRKPSRLVTP
ncbi:glycosyltransferase [Marinagarivorans cellulosilyticus]|uniref:Glycosyltransferase n=1 Tax=Marinagarivorans cellulosilyticus TaxID=2721545 RepID=A0AAN1WH72_9GAMM|nr:glycosyltransferase [Marinagarivorans cellulosilyticus]BCD97537.1 hypothetical protein MARGE09_P1738 [Marinagarivorans cellulosilyticus]